MQTWTLDRDEGGWVQVVDGVGVGNLLATLAAIREPMRWTRTGSGDRAPTWWWAVRKASATG